MTHWIHVFYETLEGLGYTHAIHPTQVHMVIGLLVGALIFALLALRWKTSSLHVSARHCFLLAAVFAFPAILTGLMDWQYFLSGIWFSTIQGKLALSGLLLILLGTGCVLGRKGRGNAPGMLLIYLFCFLTVGALGYLGGSLVQRGISAEPARNHAEGRAIFESNCAGCHPGGGNVSDPEKPVLGSPMLRNFEVFENWLRDPAPPMPAYPPEDLSREEVRKLHEYLVHGWNSS